MDGRGWNAAKRAIAFCVATPLVALLLTACDLGTILPTTFHVENNLYTPLQVSVLGGGTRSDSIIPAGGEDVWEFRDDPGVVSYSATTRQTTPSGVQLGRSLEWSGSANLSGAGFTTQHFESGNSIVYIYLRNSGDSRLANIRVYEASGGAWDLPVGVPADGKYYGIGYFGLATRVTACFAASLSCIEWVGMDYPASATNISTILDTGTASVY